MKKVAVAPRQYGKIGTVTVASCGNVRVVVASNEKFRRQVRSILLSLNEATEGNLRRRALKALRQKGYRYEEAGELVAITKKIAPQPRNTTFGDLLKAAS